MKTAELFFIVISMGYSYAFLVVLHRLILMIQDNAVRKFWLVQASLIFLRQVWMMVIVSIDGVDIGSIGHSLLTIGLMSWQMYYLNKRYAKND